MADLNGFDSNQVEPSVPFEPIPAGLYEAVITESETKATKAGTGHYLQLKFQIIGGEHNNRLLWTRLNLKNPSPIAVEIAKADLSAICRAVGVMAPRDSVELHNLPLVIHVRCKKRTDTDEIVNEIQAYSKKETVPPAENAAPTADKTPPWKRT